MWAVSVNGLLELERDLCDVNMTFDEKVKRRDFLLLLKVIAEKEQDEKILKEIKRILNNYTIDFLMEEELRNTLIEHGY